MSAALEASDVSFAYGERVAVDGSMLPVHSTHFLVRLAPGAGGRLKITMDRYAATPTLSQPWDLP